MDEELRWTGQAWPADDPTWRVAVGWRIDLPRPVPVAFRLELHEDAELEPVTSTAVRAVPVGTLIAAHRDEVVRLARSARRHRAMFPERHDGQPAKDAALEALEARAIDLEADEPPMARRYSSSDYRRVAVEYVVAIAEGRNTSEAVAAWLDRSTRRARQVAEDARNRGFLLGTARRGRPVGWLPDGAEEWPEYAEARAAERLEAARADGGGERLAAARRFGGAQ